MKWIGGNLTATIETATNTQNSIGEQESTWKPAATMTGWLDYNVSQTAKASYQKYDSKIEESTHIFLTDWQPLPPTVTSETARMIIDGKRYAIQMIDDPMNLHEHYEIYLKYTGGQ